MTRTIARTLVTLAMLFSAGACGDDNGPTAPADITGTYPLRTINRATLPYTVFQLGTSKYEITAGSAELNAGGTFTLSVSSRETIDGQAQPIESYECAGTYTRSGSNVTLNVTTSDANCDPGPSTGVISGTTLTVTEEGLTFVFRK